MVTLIILMLSLMINGGKIVLVILLMIFITKVLMIVLLILLMIFITKVLNGNDHLHHLHNSCRPAGGRSQIAHFDSTLIKAAILCNDIKVGSSGKILNLSIYHSFPIAIMHYGEVVDIRAKTVKKWSTLEIISLLIFIQHI